jgi:hypothetical protein
MADVARSDPRPKLSVAETWRLLNFEQRVAAVGAVLLIVSTFGPFSFVEAAIVLVAASILLLLRRRAQGRDFHVPFGDGMVIAAGGVWTGLLIVVRLFDRPLGQNMLALVCSAILVLAGLRERAKHPLDDLPPPREGDRETRDRDREPRGGAPAETVDETGWTEPVPDRSPYRDDTLPLKEVDPQRPAKVLPPAPREEDLEPPPAWGEPPGKDRG